MRRALIGAVVAWWGWVGVVASPLEVEVEARGIGAITADRAASLEEAIHDAKRNAVEQAVGILLNAEALAQDYEVVWETIYTRSQGYIKRWELVGEPQWNHRTGLVQVRIRAVVSAVEAIRHLSEIPEVYAALERPRVGVKLVLEDTRQPDPHSTAALVHALRVRGFEVVDGTSANAEVLVVGTVRAEPGIRLGDKDAPYGLGAVIGTHKARAEVRVLWADTQGVIVAPFRWEANGFSFNSNEEARREALQAVGRDLVEEDKGALAHKILAALVTQLQNGLRMRLVLGRADYRLLSQLADVLRGVRGVSRVERERIEGGEGIIEVVVRQTPALFRRQLQRLRIGNQRLVIIRHSPSQIRLTLRSDTQKTIPKRGGG